MIKEAILVIIISVYAPDDGTYLGDKRMHMRVPSMEICEQMKDSNVEIIYNDDKEGMYVRTTARTMILCNPAPIADQIAP